jgi:hypothetical protein
VFLTFVHINQPHFFFTTVNVNVLTIIMSSTVVPLEMATNQSVEEKATPADRTNQTNTPVEDEEEKFPIPQPYKFGPIKIPNYHSATAQVLIAGFVNFLAVGESSPQGQNLTGNSS